MHKQQNTSLLFISLFAISILWGSIAKAGTCESYGCKNVNEIWCKDSNEEPHHYEKTCPSGKYCYDSDQKNNPFDKIWCCKPHTGITCVNGNVHWENSCYVAEDLKEKCYYGCSKGVGCDKPPTYNCSNECPGCCDGNVCAKGTNNSYCGKNGNKCEKCGSGYECSGSKSCQKICLKHDHKSCTGQKIVWKDCNGNTNDDYLVCQYGCNNASGCNPAPTYVCSEKCSGCCDGNYCRNGDTTNYCGKSGENCKSCGAEKCNNNVCNTPVPPYNCANDCSGCCVGNSCKDGKSNSVCGLNGNTCQDCGVGYTCINKLCIQNPKPYVCSEKCSGCCDGNYCRNGDTTNYCGKSGENCKSCGAEKCNNNVCNTPVPPYNCANDCLGCCKGNSCKSGNSNSVCGLNGNICQDCGIGYTCFNKLCIQNPKPYDCSKECSGCCADNKCQLGMEDNSCGKDGNICSACNKGYFCYQQKCNENALKAFLCKNKSCGADGNVYCNDNNKSEIVTACDGSIDDETMYYCDENIIMKLTKSSFSKCDQKKLMCGFTDTSKKDYHEGCFNKCVQEKPTEMPYCFGGNTCNNKCVLDKTKCVSKLEYKKCFGDANGCTYWSDIDFTCGANAACEQGFCVSLQETACTVTKGYWDKLDAVDGDYVNMIIETKGNCAGVGAVFQVVESDGWLPGDKAGTTKVSLYNASHFEIPWKAFWQLDQDAYPEYKFVVYVSGKMKESSMGLLTVTPTMKIELGSLNKLYENLNFDEDTTCKDISLLSHACIDLSLAGGQSPDDMIFIPEFLKKEETYEIALLVGWLSCSVAVIACAATIEAGGGACWVFAAPVNWVCVGLTFETLYLNMQLKVVSTQVSILRLKNMLVAASEINALKVVTTTVKSTFGTVVGKAKSAKNSVYLSLVRRRATNGIVSTEYRKWTDPIFATTYGNKVLLKNSKTLEFYRDIGTVNWESKQFISALEGNQELLFDTYKIEEALKQGILSDKVKVWLTESKFGNNLNTLGVNEVDISYDKGSGFYKIVSESKIYLNLNALKKDFLSGKISEAHAVNKAVALHVHEITHSEKSLRIKLMGMKLISIPNLKRHVSSEFINEIRIVKYPGTTIDTAKLKAIGYVDLLMQSNRKMYYSGMSANEAFSNWNSVYWQAGYQTPYKWSLLEFYKIAELVGDKKLMLEIEQNFIKANDKASWLKFLEEGVSFEKLGELWATVPYGAETKEFMKLSYHFGMNVVGKIDYEDGAGTLINKMMAPEIYESLEETFHTIDCDKGDVRINYNDGSNIILEECEIGCTDGKCVDTIEKAKSVKEQNITSPYDVNNVGNSKITQPKSEEEGKPTLGCSTSQSSNSSGLNFTILLCLGIILTSVRRRQFS